jgi:SPP1 family predicted phage head-tail adaptor
MTKIASSSFNQRISFYHLQNSVDTGYGNVAIPVEYWADTYATVTDVTLRRNLQRVSNAGNFLYETTLEFKLRYREDKDVKITDIIKYRRKGYSVLSIIPDYINKEIISIIAVTNQTVFNDETT